MVNQRNNIFQYNCLRLARERHSDKDERYSNIREIDIINHEIMLYCMNEFSSKFHIEEKRNSFPNFTFFELSKQKISIKELYLWSASIDLIENYQFYLNEFDFSLSKEIFFNCTLPRFGPQCQYEFDSYYSNFDEVIHEYYRINEYDPITLTCYTHLKCSRGPFPSCLDWSEICDGKFDCLDGKFDEEHCWQLQMNECNDNEYQCSNGQCIPKIFYQDDKNIFDCLDGSDEILYLLDLTNPCHQNQPIFGCEDRICKEKSLTSSCVNKRKYLLMKSILSVKDNLTSEDCWFAIKCMFDGLEEFSCLKLYTDNLLLKIYLDSCPEMFFIPNYPILYGDTYIAVKKIYSKEIFDYENFPLYICYNHHSHYDASVNTISISETLFNNKTCLEHYRPKFTLNMKSMSTNYYKFEDFIYGTLKQYRLLLNYTSTICNQSNMYQCQNSSKCILIHNLFNGYRDCPYSDDENMFIINNNSNLIKQLNKTHFYCQSKKNYISQNMINNHQCDCNDKEIGRCIDENLGEIDSSRDILFQTICDGFQELSPIIINNKNETDETECEQWECDNVYTHCNGIWNCFNGKDEIGCDDLSKSKCSLNQHLCVSLLTYQLICLDIHKVYDGNLDCVGGTDEPIRTIRSLLPNGLLNYTYKFSCRNETPSPDLFYFMLCDGHNRCKYEDDEKFCETNQKNFAYRGICLPDNIKFASDAEKLLCKFVDIKSKKAIIHFTIDNFNKSVSKNNNQNKILSSSSSQEKSRCHRGVNLRVWLNNLTNFLCLCPSNYYGSDCEYQNERISLAIQFRSLSDSWQTQFAIIILLIDDSNDRIIHSYEQINYSYLKNCRTKFQFYLLYSTRPKDSTKTYSIHIDFYEKKSLIHRGSLLLPIYFPFLPVYRHALIVNIPRINNIENEICFNRECIHGKCIKYFNNLNNFTFCQCDKGWSGKSCHIQYSCTCSSDSLCLGISAINNRSICVCPANKFGPRCLLTIQINNKTKCENGGEYISNNNDLISNEEFQCICPKGYSGDRCEILDNKLSLAFSKDIVLSQEIFIHFIEIVENSAHIRLTTFQTILFQKDLINITWSQPFHIVFVDIFNKTYYLISVENNSIRSKQINKLVNSSSRCPHINELFNETFIQLNLIRRIKYYNLPCQNESLNLSCFYDEIHFCLCYQFSEKRLANCFTFDHNMKFNCLDQNECENDGECFQDHPQCPTKSICKCPSCYFGQRCHLTTNGFGLSLDVILGYQIFPYLSINDQPLIIKLSLSLTIILIITGFVNSILSLITFSNKSVCEVGCGLYLLSSSITTLLTTIMFGLKYFILLLSHMSMIRNRIFLSGQCYSFDFILKIFLSLDQWLNALVAIERTITMIKGASFNKKESAKTAKLMIIILLILIVISYIHDPIHRKLIDEINNGDNRQNRIWCIVNYSSNFKIYNSFIHTFHFISPFIINLLSVIIFLGKKIRQQSNLHRHQPYKNILYKIIKEHQNLLIAPFILVLLGLPRLILLFVSKCMKSAHDVWLFLCGYFISFIPSMLTFLIFILPSSFYREIFRKTLKRSKNNILRWFGFIQ
jgi:hypothetical protein